MQPSLAIAGLGWGGFASLGVFAFAEGAVGDLAQQAGIVVEATRPGEPQVQERQLVLVEIIVGRSYARDMYRIRAICALCHTIEKAGAKVKRAIAESW